MKYENVRITEIGQTIIPGFYIDWKDVITEDTGEIIVYFDYDGVKIDSEYMSKDFIAYVLRRMVDDATLQTL